jgi:peptidoglycan/LPS O-acetylase OafA/YrhL
MRAEIPSLNTLRAVACLLVFCSHAGNRGLFISMPDAGQLGVMLFFSLSGFLMTYHYAHYATLREWRTYAILRFARIYPGYAMVLLTSWLLYTHVHVDFAWPMTGAELWKHLLLQGRIGPFWSIPPEMAFYCIFPFVSVAVAAVTRSAAVQCVLLLACWLASSCIGGTGNASDLSTTLPFFLAGMVFGYARLKQGDQRQREYAAFNALTASCLCVIVVCVPRLFHYLFGFDHGMWQDRGALSLVIGLTVFGAANLEGSFEHWFSHPFLRYIGKISFSMYLINPTVLNGVKEALPGQSAAILLAASIGLTLVIASVMYVTIEQPCRRLARQLSIAGNRLSHFRPTVRHSQAIALDR